MSELLSTRNLPRAKRFPFWQDAVCDTFVELDCQPTVTDWAFGEIATTQIEAVHLSVVRASGQRVCRTRSRISPSPTLRAARRAREDTTVCEYLWSRRLERSRQRLAAPERPDASIAEIAFAHGFSEVAHFSRRFKAAYGMTPRDYRQAARASGFTCSRRVRCGG